MNKIFLLKQSQDLYFHVQNAQEGLNSKFEELQLHCFETKSQSILQGQR